MAGCRTNSPPDNTTCTDTGAREGKELRMHHSRKLHVSVYENAQTIVRWLLPAFKGLYDTHTQLASISHRHAKCCVRYVYIHTYSNSDWHFLYTETVIRNACVTYTMMKYVLLRWTPSLNDRGKLKGECTDVKSWYCTIIRRTYSLNPHSLSLKKNFSCYNCPFKVGGWFESNHSESTAHSMVAHRYARKQ